MHSSALVEGKREHAKRAGFPGELDLAPGEKIPALVVPHSYGRSGGEPEPAQRFPLEMSSPEKALSARFNVGAAAAWPCVTTSPSPSTPRSAPPPGPAAAAA